MLLPSGTDFPSDETMIKTAAELRYSETAFIKQLSDNEFNVRYFTPVARSCTSVDMPQSQLSTA